MLTAAVEYNVPPLTAERAVAGELEPVEELVEMVHIKLVAAAEVVVQAATQVQAATVEPIALDVQEMVAAAAAAAAVTGRAVQLLGRRVAV
jgi:hypothetical protein